jgi:glycosyltransferase involved in cell wall biosynthesis
LRVLVDDQVFAAQVRGGISRYFVELIRYISKSPAIELVQPWRWTRNAHAIDAGIASALPTPLGRRRRVIELANRLAAPHGTVDVVHHTFYDRDRQRLRGQIRVVTVHDMIPELHPGLFARGNPHADKRECVGAADLVLCVSESTRTDLLRLYGAVHGDVVVVPLGVDDMFQPGLPRLDSLPVDYVLFVGQRRGYKDFAVLLDAIAALTPDHPDLHVVAVGGGTLSREDAAAIAGRALTGRVTQVSLSDGELARAYANARCFAFPSRYEGFGLPTLEAMATGCPVVVAESSSHVEVGGDAARYFPPGNHRALAHGLREALEPSGYGAARRAAGVQRAAQFSWSRTGEATVAAYAACLEARPARAPR